MATETFADRLRTERADLSERMLKLRTFVDSADAFKNLPALDQSLLTQQLAAMAAYEAVLSIRCFRGGV